MLVRTVGRVGQQRTAPLVMLVMLLALAVLTAVAPPADSYNLGSCRWTGTSARYYISANKPPQTNITGAVSDWNSRTNAFTLIPKNKAVNRDFKVRSKQFGFTGVSGLWHKDGNTSAGVACNNNRWVPKDGVASVNSTYGNGQERRSTTVHELGHAMGLGHENGSAGPCGSDYGYLSVMYFSGARFSGACAVFAPTNDDLRGLDARY